MVWFERNIVSKMGCIYTPLLVGAAGKLGLGVALAVAALVPAVLVRVVQTVVVAVADVDARYAVAVVARKQVAEARLGARLAVIRWLIRPYILRKNF